MKKYKVHYNTKSGRITHRYFLAPTLLEAQMQFAACPYGESVPCEWFGCPYISVQYKDEETKKIVSEDLDYIEYTKEYPNRQISFIAYLEKKSKEK